MGGRRHIFGIARIAVYVLIITIVLTIISTGIQIREVRKRGPSNEFMGGLKEQMEEFSLTLFGIVLPFLLAFLMIPLYLSVTGTERNGPGRCSRGMIFYGITVNVIFLGDPLILLLGNISDGFRVYFLLAPIMMILSQLWLAGSLIMLIREFPRNIEREF